MSKLNWRKWKKANDWTWQELKAHLWEEFRLALYEAETEADATGVRLEFSRVINEVRAEMKLQGVRVEFGRLVSETTTQMVVNVIATDRDYLSVMLEYLPYFERNTSTFNDILTAYDRQFRQVEQDVDVVERNAFIDTTIEALDIHERDLNIDNRELSLAYDQRREQIEARYRAVFGQTTEDAIKIIASAFANGEVELSQADTPGMFKIRFVGLGVPKNIVGLSRVLDAVFPAHLGYVFEYTYNTWGILNEAKWNEVQKKTWNEAREWEDVI